MPSSRSSARLRDRLGPAVTFATTEHFHLQSARAATVTQANGRASIYMAALSSTLIALAFIGQVSRLGTAFYAQRIGRLRDLYVAVAPELAAYVLVINSVVLGACAGLLLQAVGVGGLGTVLAAGAVVGAVTLRIQRRRHDRARDTYAPDAIDRASISAPSAEAT